MKRGGMTEAQIETALRKKKRRKLAEFNALKSRHVVHDPGQVAFRTGGEELCTVEDAARRLKLHARTVLRFIHEQRLPATRIGKSFRILRRDLEAFAGVPSQIDAAPEPATVTCIVDIPSVGEDLARDWARVMPAALNSRTSDRPPVRAEIVYDPQRSQLKIVLVSTVDVVADLLRLVERQLARTRG